MIYTFLYVFASALFGIVVHIVGSTMPPWLLIFLCAVNTMLFFHIINIFSLSKVYRNLFKQQKLLVLGTMVFIALSTIGAFLVPIYFMPAEFLFSYICGLTLLGSIDSYWKSRNTIDKLQVSGLVVILVLFYVLIYHSFNSERYIIFIAATLFVSIVTYGYFVLSYKLYQNGMSSINVLTVRFWPLAICSGAWSYEKHYFNQLTVLGWVKIFLLSIILLVLPIYLGQKSIEKAGPDIHAIFMGFIPFLTLTSDIIFWGQHELNKLTIIFWILSLVLAITITITRLIKMQLSTRTI